VIDLPLRVVSRTRPRNGVLDGVQIASGKWAVLGVLMPILETHHPGYRALRHIATGSSVKIKCVNA